MAARSGFVVASFPLVVELGFGAESRAPVFAGCEVGCCLVA